MVLLLSQKSARSNPSTKKPPVKAVPPTEPADDSTPWGFYLFAVALLLGTPYILVAGFFLVY